jgi:geranylgeranyl pyrophosphate synthase
LFTPLINKAKQFPCPINISIPHLFCLQVSVLAGDFLLSRACGALAALGNYEVNTWFDSFDFSNLKIGVMQN